ncbi:unnamed protein product [Peniophora sp. CBMAI 1063]|nr:unnamed protein product [Peniophora sp. CBMAI 1063]
MHFLPAPTCVTPPPVRTPRLKASSLTAAPPTLLRTSPHLWTLSNFPRAHGSGDMHLSAAAPLRNRAPSGRPRPGATGSQPRLVTRRRLERQTQRPLPIGYAADYAQLLDGLDSSLFLSAPRQTPEALKKSMSQLTYTLTEMAAVPEPSTSPTDGHSHTDDRKQSPPAFLDLADSAARLAMNMLDIAARVELKRSGHGRQRTLDRKIFEDQMRALAQQQQQELLQLPADRANGLQGFAISAPTTPPRVSAQTFFLACSPLSSSMVLTSTTWHM